MKVVLAEKPSVARDIANVLGASKRNDGYFSGGDYAVTWALGHLVTIAAPESMDARWGKPWSLGQLPMIPGQWQYSVREQTAAQFHCIEKLLNNRTTTEVICATDAGREGEHIFRLIYAQAQCSKPVKRLWISALTAEAIRARLNDLHPGADFDALASAARARAHADWIVGLNATRAYTLHNRQVCTVGRVQTPTLALIVEREKEIRAFVPSSYFEVQATFEPGFTAKYIDAKGETSLPDTPQAAAIHDAIEPIPAGTVISVESQDKTLTPPPLFDLVTLQREANEKFGYTAKDTLAIAQALYETHKIFTYPRTESRHLSAKMINSLPGILEAVPARFDPARSQALRRATAGPPLSKAYVDDSKLTDHHAIIPTTRRAPESLPERERNLYEVVVIRFLGIFLPNAVRSDTVVLLQLGEHTFRATGSVMKEPGWTVLKTREPQKKEQESEEEPDQSLPVLEPGQVVAKTDSAVVEKKRRPPRAYTDASLLAAMKNAGRLVTDETLAAYMKHNGLGTAATRAEIIERLIQSQYLDRQKKALIPTPKGMALIAQVHPGLRDPVTTADWEQKLKQIEDAELDASSFEDSIGEFIRELLPHIANSQAIERTLEAGMEQPGATQKISCPVCKTGEIREIKPKQVGNRNSFWGCSNYRNGCKFSVNGVIAGKKLSSATVKKLCQQEKAPPLKGFHKKNGGTFDAALALDSSYKVIFQFDAKRAGAARPS
jgi:DNA topoisomerase III